MAKDLKLGMTKGSFKAPVERAVKRGFRHQTEEEKMKTAMRVIKSSSRGLKYLTVRDYLSKVNPSLLDSNSKKF